MIAEVVKWNDGLILCPFSTRRIHAQRAECKMDTFCGAEIVLLRIHPKKTVLRMKLAVVLAMDGFCFLTRAKTCHSRTHSRDSIILRTGTAELYERGVLASVATAARRQCVKCES